MGARWSRREAIVGGAALTFSVPFLGACADDGDSPVGASGDTTGPAPSTAALDRLADDGDAGFDQLYASTPRDGAALVVGTAGGLAVGYLCDPTGPARWFSGTVDGDAVSLSNADGSRLTGTVGAGIDATLDGAGSYDGAYSLAASPDITLARGAATEAGSPVGGLIIDGFVATGSFPATRLPVAAGTTTSTIATLGTSLDGVTIGLRIAAGSKVDIAVTVSSARPLTRDQAAEVLGALEARRQELQTLVGTTVDAAKRAESQSSCTKVMNVIAAVVVVVVAVVIAAFTFGAAGALVALAVIAAAAIIGSVVAAQTELTTIIGRPDSLQLLDRFVRINDTTSGQVILNALRQGVARLAVPATTSTTAPTRVFPDAGTVALTLR